MDNEDPTQSQPARYLGSRRTGETVPSISTDSNRTILTSSNDSTLPPDEVQMALWGEYVRENPDYLSKQLITYIGNKRALLDPIGKAIAKVKRRLGTERLRMLDAFSGSGIVSRYFKQHASYLVSNDIEDYAATIGRCYLRNRSTVDFGMLEEIVEDLNARVDCENFPMGFIEEMYSPRCEEEISKDDRVFYTRRNARRLDNYGSIASKMLIHRKNIKMPL